MPLVSAPVRAELRPLYPGRVIPPVVAFAAYFDESKSRNAGILTIAGYLASVESWDSHFVPRWDSVIAGAPQPISEFKASDCRNERGEFKGWTCQERDGLTADLVSTIIDEPRHQIMGIGASVIVDYGHIRSTVLKKKLERFAYLWCVALAVRIALVFVKRHIGNDHVQIVFDEEKHMKHRITSIFDLAREQFAGGWAGHIRDPHFAPSHEVAPLQAADLLAFETFTAMVHMTTKSRRTPSKALVRLLEGRYHLAQYFDVQDLFAYRRRFEAGELAADEGFEFSTLYDSRPPEILIEPA